ncbi:MAG: hypothetical protein Q9216_003658 [Gyalolechia sp. 2 TL-2023]
MATTSTLTRRPLTMSASGVETKTSADSRTEEVPTSDASARGAEVYSRFRLLAIYDWWVLGIVSSLAWACSVRSFTVPWCRRSIRKGEHLDIGVGTGFCLTRADLTGVKLTLVDLNQDSLDTTKRRLVDQGKAKAEETRCLLHDITRPLPPSCPKFNSVSLYYLLHCMPGPVAAKTAVFAHLKHSMTPDGVISGTSVLGKGVSHNIFGRLIMLWMNGKGWFDNRADNAEDFTEALKEHFHFVETRIEGVVFVWRASNPRV